jgi:hypothetical protein
MRCEGTELNESSGYYCLQAFSSSDSFEETFLKTSVVIYGIIKTILCE